MRPVQVVLAVVAALTPAVAHADDDDKRACMKAYVSAQSLRAAVKIREAHESALACARAVCPTLLRNDCVGWARDLEAVMPTAVFSVVDGAGTDRADARVLVDKSVLARLDGGSVALDPGTHTVHCELPGAGAMDTKVILREGERDRPVRCAFPPHGPSAPPPGDPPSKAPPGRVPVLTYVLGGVGVAALGTWVGFGGSALIWGDPSLHTLHQCQPNCTTSDRDDVHTKLVVADVAGAAAILALGGAAVLYFTRGPAVSATPTQGGAAASLRWRF